MASTSPVFDFKSLSLFLPVGSFHLPVINQLCILSCKGESKFIENGLKVLNYFSTGLTFFQHMSYKYSSLWHWNCAYIYIHIYKLNCKISYIHSCFVLTDPEIPWAIGRNLPMYVPKCLVYVILCLCSSSVIAFNMTCKFMFGSPIFLAIFPFRLYFLGNKVND